MVGREWWRGGGIALGTHRCSHVVVLGPHCHSCTVVLGPHLLALLVSCCHPRVAVHCLSFIGEGREWRNHCHSCVLGSHLPFAHAGVGPLSICCPSCSFFICWLFVAVAGHLWLQVSSHEVFNLPHMF